MRRLMAAIVLSLLTFPALSQSSSKYQIAVVTEVKPHEAAAGDSASDRPRYDVSVKVGETIYVVLYTEPWGELPAKYATGHELLVSVGKDAITYNDMLGRSLQVPIESQRPATDPKHAK